MTALITVCRGCGREFEPDRQTILKGTWRICPACRPAASEAAPAESACRECGRVLCGKTVETVEYPAYCAVALAGLGDLPDTILTRSVVIRMRRRGSKERVEPFRRRLAAAEGHAPPNGHEFSHEYAGFGVTPETTPAANDAAPPRNATRPVSASRVADVADVADVRGDREVDGVGAQEAANGHGAAVIAQAKELATLSPAEMAAYRTELDAAPANDPHLATDLESLALFDAVQAAGATL